MKTISLKVIPRSSKNEIKKQEDGSYRVKLTAAPVDGAANEALIKFLSEEFHVPKSKVTILKGETGRKKIVQIQS